MPTLNDRTREHYDSLLPQLTESYIDYRWQGHPQKELHYLQTRRTLRKILEEYAPAVEEMLEVGCGPGTWTDECLRHSTHLTLLDISQEMLREAHERYHANKSVSLVCGDFISGSIGRRGCFDAIASVRALEYMTPKRAFVRNARELLRPGGILIVITKNPGWRDAGEASGFASKNSASIHTDWISWSTLRDVLTEERMSVRTVRPATIGSYNSPFANFVSRRACHLLHRLTLGIEMSSRWDGFTESYILVARKISGNSQNQT